MNKEHYSDNKHNKQLSIAVVSGYVLINNGRIQNQYKISSKHPFFKNEHVKVDVSYDCLIFSLPTIDCLGKMYKTHINNNNTDWRSFSVVSDLLVTGKFEVDTEDSSEDELVVYYR